MLTAINTGNIESSSDESCPDSDYISSDDESWLQQSHTAKQNQGTLRDASELSITGNDALVHDISEHIYCVWKDVGRHLLMRECLIDNIDIDYEKDGEKEKAYQMLLTWKRRMGSRANARNLQKVLRHIGRRDIADAIPCSYRGPFCKKLFERQQASKSSERTKSEVESHLKLQKQVKWALGQDLKSYQKQVREIEDLKSRVLELEEARECQEKLRQLDNVEIKRTLDSLQKQLRNMEQKYRDSSERDKQLKKVADQLFVVDQIFNPFNDIVADLRVACCMSQVCKFSGIFGQLGRVIRFPQTNCTPEKSKSVKTEEHDIVFQDPCWTTRRNYQRRHSHEMQSTPSHPSRVPHSLPWNMRLSNNYGRDEKHVRKKLSVSSLGTDEQFQLQELVANSESKLEEIPDAYSQCISIQDSVQGFQMDFSNLPIPCYKSSEDIALLVTRIPSPPKYCYPVTFGAGECSQMNTNFSLQQGYFSLISDLV